MEGKLLILSANQWNFADETTGERRKGTTLHVTHLGKSEESDNSVGNRPKKYTLDFSFFEKVKDLDLPCKALGIFDYNFNRDKMELNEIKNVVALNG